MNVSNVEDLQMLSVQPFLHQLRKGGDSVTKMELIEMVSEKSGFSKKDANKAVKAVFDSMSDVLEKGDKVQLVGFGSFEVKDRPARKGRNPQTGEEISVSARKVPVFKPGKNLKEIVNK